MREMPWQRLLAVALVLGGWTGLAAAVSYVVVRPVPVGGPFLYASAFVIAWGIVGTILHRVLMYFFPLLPGEIEAGSRQEFVYQVFYNPFFFFLVYPLAFSGLLPVPLSRLFYKLFGARIGTNTYPGRCMVFDPRFVTLGEMVVMGYNACLVPHVMEGTRLAHAVIRIGNHATIGVNAVLFAGVSVGDGAVIAAGSVVPKFTQIGAREIWGGLPARRIGYAGQALALPDQRQGAADLRS